MKQFKICPSCGTRNLPHEIECTNCEEDLMNVSVTNESTQNKQVNVVQKVNRIKVCYCGAKNPSNARKCVECGEDISTIVAVIDDNKKVDKVYLNAIDSDYSFEIMHGTTSIGREANMKEYLKDKSYVSRVHAEISYINGVIYIVSSGVNHSFINNVQIKDNEMIEIRDGDVVSLGGKEIDGKRQENAAHFRVTKK